MKVVIDRRFCGPKHSGNGGYSAGLFAQAVEGPASVTLKSPPPLGEDIDLRQTSKGAEAVFDGTVIATVAPARVAIDPPEIPNDDGVTCAHDAFLSDAGGKHMIPYCFVCGDRRAEGDGMRLFTGPAPGSPVNADFWTPPDEFADEDGFVRPEFVWAALDCPTAFALRLWPRVSLLGRLAVEIRRRPKPGRRLIVAAWPDRSEGRKHFASAALLDNDRDIIAAANALWVELDDRSPILAQLAKDRGD